MGNIDKSLLDKALSHTEQEIGFDNIRASIKSNYELIQKTHDSIHEFLYLAPICLPNQTGVSWHSRSAFLLYHYEAFNQAHRSLLEALAGYYNAAYILLRSTLELIVRGAFWECLAHKKFRDTSAVLVKSRGKLKSLRDWIDSIIEQRFEVDKDLEETSAAILDKTSILFNDKEFQKQFVRMPSFSIMIQQLIKWEVIDICNPFDKLYTKLYGNLSKDVHSFPDATDVGRKLVSEKDFMETEVIPGELLKFSKTLHEIIDIGIVIELNILRDWIQVGGITKLKDRANILRDLELNHSIRKLNSLIESRVGLTNGH